MVVLDVMPTILEFLDLTPPPDIQGESLLPVARGTGSLPPRKVYLSLSDGSSVGAVQDYLAPLMGSGRPPGGGGLFG